MTKPVITIWQAKDVPDLWNDLIESWFWHEFNWPMARIAPMNWRVLVTAGEDLIGHIGLLRRTVHPDRNMPADDQALTVGGISGVMVRPAYRGQGLGQAAMQQAVEFLRDETDVAFGFLICEDHRLSFYEMLGWQEIHGQRMFYRDWQGEIDEVGHHKMIYPLRTNAVWPTDGDLDFGDLFW